MSDDDYFQYVPPPTSPLCRLSSAARRRMYLRFLEMTGVRPEETILDVGVTSEANYASNNPLENLYPHKSRITAVGLDDASWLCRRFEGLQFVRMGRGALPFRDASLDLVFSNAVIEHVGSRANQEAFLLDLWRVAKRGVFITTPNRWYPIELHTALPVVHWLPRRWSRTVLGLLGRTFYASEDNLNLLSRSDLVEICEATGIRTFQIATVSTLGLPSNLLLWAVK